MKPNVEGCCARGSRGGALLKLIVFLVVFAGVLTAAWIFALPAVLTSTLGKRTGFGVKVTELALNPFNAKVDLSGLVLTNPGGFPRSDFMEVKSFQANAKLKTLFSDRPEFDYARVEVAYVTLVRDADGILNATLFDERISPRVLEEAEQEKAASSKASKGDAKDNKAKLESRDSSKAKSEATAAKTKAKKANNAAAAPKKPMNFLIHRLEVRLEKIIVADYAGGTPDVREFDVKMFWAYNEVSDPNQLLAPFAFRSLAPVGAAIRGLIPGTLGKSVDAATGADDIFTEAEKPKAKTDTLKTVVEKLEESQKP